MKTMNGTKRTDLYQITDPAIIRVQDGFNARQFTRPEVQAHIAALAEDFKELIGNKRKGILSPVTVRRMKDETGEYCLVVDGECRVRAWKKVMAEGIDIPLPIRYLPVDEKGAVLEMARADFLKHPFTTTEKARIVARLRAQGMSYEEIGAALGRTSSWASLQDKLALRIDSFSETIPDLLKQIDTGTIPADVVLKAPSPQSLLAAQQVVQEARQSGKKANLRREVERRAGRRVRPNVKDVEKLMRVLDGLADDSPRFTVADMQTVLRYAIGEISETDMLADVFSL